LQASAAVKRAVRAIMTVWSFMVTVLVLWWWMMMWRRFVWREFGGKFC
jgi:hypothetical protein